MYFRRILFLTELYLSKQSSAFFRSSVLGIRDDPKIFQSFRNTGLLPFLAISGFHLGILSLLTLVFSQITGKKILIPVLMIYLLCIGIPVSAFRAFLFILLVHYSLSIKRQVLPLRLFFISGCLHCFVFPHDVLSPGFALSYGAVLNLMACRNTVGSSFDSFLSSCFRIQFFMFPLTGFLFQSVPLPALILYPIFTPLLSLVIANGFLVVMTGIFPCALLKPMLFLYGKQVQLIVSLITFFSRAYTGKSPAYICIAALVAVITFVAIKNQEYRIFILGFVLLLLLYTPLWLASLDVIFIYHGKNSRVWLEQKSGNMVVHSKGKRDFQRTISRLLELPRNSTVSWERLQKVETLANPDRDTVLIQISE